MAASLACPKCQAALPPRLDPLGDPGDCPGCYRPLEGLLFPAFHRPALTGTAAEPVVAPEDASCFYHAESRAQVPCDLCGRFLCALCDLELHGQHLCPACLNSGKKKQTLRQFDDSRVIYGQVALYVALLPLFFWPATIITGPLAVFFAIYGWNKPQSLTGKRRLGAILAIILGLAQTGAWIALLVAIFTSFD